MLTGTLYPGGGVRVSGWPSSYPPSPEGVRKYSRGTVGNASAKSLRRCSFNLQNCSVKWEIMITLTFRTSHPGARAVFRRWCSLMPWTGKPAQPWGWFREYQSRGVVHYHVVLGEGVLAASFGEDSLVSEVVGRGKKRRTVVRGRPERWIVDRWVEAVGDLSVAFMSFQEGGIVELLRDADSPSKYLGAYASKASQKRLPPGESPGGRWWFLSDACKLVPRGTFTLWSWPLAYPSSVIWDYQQLEL